MFTRKRKSARPMNLLLACYSPDHWQELLATADDSENLELTWSEWRKNADMLIDGLKSEGRSVTEVLIDINDLSHYCRMHDLPNNAETRSKYVLRIHGEST